MIVWIQFSGSLRHVLEMNTIDLDSNVLWLRMFIIRLWVRKFCPGGSEVKASVCNAGDLGSIPGSGRSPAEGNGNPLQYSWLENPMDGGAWWATVHGVAKSRTLLSDFTLGQKTLWTHVPQSFIWRNVKKLIPQIFLLVYLLRGLQNLTDWDPKKNEGYFKFWGPKKKRTLSDQHYSLRGNRK